MIATTDTNSDMEQYQFYNMKVGLAAREVPVRNIVPNKVTIVDHDTQRYHSTGKISYYPANKADYLDFINNTSFNSIKSLKEFIVETIDDVVSNEVRISTKEYRNVEYQPLYDSRRANRIIKKHGIKLNTGL